MQIRRRLRKLRRRGNEVEQYFEVDISKAFDKVSRYCVFKLEQNGVSGNEPMNSFSKLFK